MHLDYKTALDFFSFKAMFEEKRLKVDMGSKEYKKVVADIETLVYNFTEHMRELFTSIKHIRNIDEFFFQESQGLDKKLVGIEELDALEKIDLGVEIIDSFLEVGAKFETNFDKMLRAIEAIDGFRMNLYEAVDSLKYLDPEHGEAKVGMESGCIWFVKTGLLVLFINWI